MNAAAGVIQAGAIRAARGARGVIRRIRALPRGAVAHAGRLVGAHRAANTDARGRQGAGPAGAGVAGAGAVGAPIGARDRDRRVAACALAAGARAREDLQSLCVKAGRGWRHVAHHSGAGLVDAGAVFTPVGAGGRRLLELALGARAASGARGEQGRVVCAHRRRGQAHRRAASIVVGASVAWAAVSRARIGLATLATAIATAVQTIEPVVLVREIETPAHHQGQCQEPEKCRSHGSETPHRPGVCNFRSEALGQVRPR